MTLKELKQAVGTPEETIHYKVLRESEDIYLQVRTENDAWITVLKNGYVLYQTGKRFTGFPITDCGDYTYTFDDGSTSVITEKEFDQYDWMVRVILEGEGRITHNINCEYYVHQLGARDGDSAETIQALELMEEEAFVDPTPTAEEQIIRKIESEQIRMILQSLVPRQKEFVIMYYVKGFGYMDIAKIWGCSVKAVRNVKYRVDEVLKAEWKQLLK